MSFGRTLVTVAAAGVAMALAGATGCSKGYDLDGPKDMGKSKVVERTPKSKPKWVRESFKDKGKYVYFTGQMLDANDMTLGMRQAKADAMQNLLESVSVLARSEFSEAIKGVNTSDGSLGRYVDSVVAWTTENLNVSGAIPVEAYSEKVRTRTYAGHDYTYNCWVWLRLPKREYLVARQAAADRAVTEFEDEEAKALAREAQEKLEN